MQVLYLVSCVHPVAILSAVFCIICSLSMLVSDALGDQIVEAYSSTGYGFVCCKYGFRMFAPFCRGEDFENVDYFPCFGCGQVYVLMLMFVQLHLIGSQAITG